MEFTKYGITETPKLIYNNPLASKSDIDGFVLEGTANISFPEGKLRMENGLSAAQGQKANYVLWCPKNFPSNVYIEWEFQPLRSQDLQSFSLLQREEMEKISLMNHFSQEQESIRFIITEI